MKTGRNEEEGVRRVLAEVALSVGKIEFRIDPELRMPELLLLESALGLLRERVRRYVERSMDGDDDE